MPAAVIGAPFHRRYNIVHTLVSGICEAHVLEDILQGDCGIFGVTPVCMMIFSETNCFSRSHLYEGHLQYHVSGNCSLNSAGSTKSTVCLHSARRMESIWECERLMYYAVPQEAHKQQNSVCLHNTVSP